jgi:hypothetical protein
MFLLKGECHEKSVSKKLIRGLGPSVCLFSDSYYEKFGEMR